MPLPWLQEITLKTWFFSKDLPQKKSLSYSYRSKKKTPQENNYLRMQRTITDLASISVLCYANNIRRCKINRNRLLKGGNIVLFKSLPYRMR